MLLPRSQSSSYSRCSHSSSLSPEPSPPRTASCEPRSAIGTLEFHGTGTGPWSPLEPDPGLARFPYSYPLVATPQCLVVPKINFGSSSIPVFEGLEGDELYPLAEPSSMTPFPPSGVAARGVFEGDLILTDLVGPSPTRLGKRARLSLGRVRALLSRISRNHGCALY